MGGGGGIERERDRAKKKKKKNKKEEQKKKERKGKQLTDVISPKLPVAQALPHRRHERGELPRRQARGQEELDGGADHLVDVEAGEMAQALGGRVGGPVVDGAEEFFFYDVGEA